MKRLALVFALASCRHPPEVHREPTPPPEIVEASAPVASSVAEPSPPPEEEPVACRRAIANPTTLAALSDADIVAAIVDGKPGAKTARDCRGDRLAYENQAVHVDRHVRDSHMAVFVSVAKELGYTSWCPGFAAIVRLDPNAIVVEGVSAEKLDDCDAYAKDLRLGTVDGRPALLFPKVLGTGEEGDAEWAWDVLVANGGALRSVGHARTGRSAGNYSISNGSWFGAMDSKLLDGTTLRVEEHWSFVRYTPSGEEQGKKQTVLRTYSLENGKLVASPKNDPSP